VFTGNTVTGASNSGFFVASNTSPVLSRNVLCGNARDLTIAGGAEPVVEDDNEICDQDAATE
jgi:hypothetical protein